MHNARIFADTVKHQIIKLPTDFMKANINATNAIEFVSSCTYRFLKMPYDKFVMVSKDKRGYVSIAFYYNDASKKILTKKLIEHYEAN